MYFYFMRLNVEVYKRIIQHLNSDYRWKRVLFFLFKSSHLDLSLRIFFRMTWDCDAFCCNSRIKINARRGKNKNPEGFINTTINFSKMSRVLITVLIYGVVLLPENSNITVPFTYIIVDWAGCWRRKCISCAET